MVVLAYEGSAAARAPALPTFSKAPFFYDRHELDGEGAPDLNPGALLADAKSVQAHFNPDVSYYFPVGVSDYVRKHTYRSTMESATL